MIDSPEIEDYSLPVTDVKDHPSTNTPPVTQAPSGPITSQDAGTTGASLIDRSMGPRMAREGQKMKEKEPELLMAVSAWTKHLETDDEKNKYVESLKRAGWLLDHILRLIEESEASLEAAEISPKSYDNPNWQYRQAHSNGYKQCLRDFTKLLTLDPKEDNGRQPIRRKPAVTRGTRSDPQ